MKKKITKFAKKNQFFLGVVLALLTLSLLPVFVSAQCTDTVANYSNGYTKTKAVIYDSSGSGSMKILYESVLSSSGKDWSHVGIYVPVCIGSSNWTAGLWSKSGSTYSFTAKKSDFSLGTDASHPSSPYVIKTKNQYNKGTTTRWYIELDTMLQTACVPMYVKPGSTFETDTIIGPSGTCGPVPVMFGKAYAMPGDGVVSVHWTTFTENNNEMFEVERLKGDQWFKIGQVAGAGNSSQRLDYTFTDNKPSFGKNWYRIKQIDYSGQFAYSPNFSTETPNPEPGLTIYPNPAKSDGAVVLSAYGFRTGTPDHSVIVHDAVGKMIFESVFSGPGNVVKITLPPGLYQVTATGLDDLGHDMKFHQRLVVQ